MLLLKHLQIILLDLISDTYGFPVVISNCSNNYGPNQFPEKLIPLVINNIINNKPIPVYGQGQNIRDWYMLKIMLWLLILSFIMVKLGDTYNVGGLNEWKNIDLIKTIIKIVDRLLKREVGTSEKLITYVTDRPGHDFRYAIDSSKINKN